MKTSNFQLTESTIDIFKKDGHVVRIKYTDINSIKIFENNKYSLKQFAIVYWIVWSVFVLGLFFLMGGVEFAFDVAKETWIWGLILTLGLLAFKPVYTMLPTGTFMDVKSTEEETLIPITDLIQDERIHGLINELKQKIGWGKIRIIK
jgi:hypothetical protein